MDTVTGSPVTPPRRNWCRSISKLFSLYGNTAGTPLPGSRLPVQQRRDLAAGNPPNGNGCANRQSISHSSDDHEQVHTARIDHNIDVKNMAWFRFQSDTGLQAAYTDPINPLFNAISSQPLYSFASGYTHVFSQHLVNYFNPAFSWYESLFGPERFREDAGGVSRSSCRAAAPTRRSRRWAGWTTPGCRGGAPRASSSMTISRGRSGRTSCGSAQTAGSSA